MFRHPLEHVSNLDDECIQPNAVDLRVVKIERVVSDYRFTLMKDGKKAMRDTRDVELTRYSDDKECWNLETGVYQFLTNHWVCVPEESVGWVIGRSTFQRNGVFITSSLYDSGFENYIGGMIYNFGGPMLIEHGTRIAQFLLCSAEMAHKYSGEYQGVKAR